MVNMRPINTHNFCCPVNNVLAIRVTQVSETGIPQEPEQVTIHRGDRKPYQNLQVVNSLVADERDYLHLGVISVYEEPTAQVVLGIHAFGRQK